MTPPSTARRLLLPLTPLYRLALSYRELRLRSGREPVRRLRFPVISIGNLSTGGAGKTPFAITLARALTGRGFSVDVLSRGYGRQNGSAARVRFDGTAAEFGDEPLLIAREAEVPVYVASQRYEAGLLAESHAPLHRNQPPQLDGKQHTKKNSVILSGGRVATEVEGPAFEDISDPKRPPLVHILDDAFQHRQLHRDVDILLLNRDDWHDRLLPAGNLREALHAAMRASVIAIPADDSELESELRAWGWQGPIWRLLRHMNVPPVDGPVVAFCGIARPHQFFAGLQSAGLRLATRVAFRDHHRYTARDLDRLLETARTSGAAALITTEKDQVRLGSLTTSLPPAFPLLTAGLRIEIHDESAALDWLIAQVRITPPSPSL